MEHLWFLGLAIPVDAADALLEPRWVEWDVEVDEPIAVCLEVDALAGRVGGEEHANRFVVGILSELSANIFALFGWGCSLDDGEYVAVTVLGEHSAEPVDCVCVLAEHDNAFVGQTFAGGPAQVVEKRHQSVKARVGSAFVT